VVIWYVFPFLYVVPIKIGQPCVASCRWLMCRDKIIMRTVNAKLTDTIQRLGTWCIATRRPGICNYIRVCLRNLHKIRAQVHYGMVYTSKVFRTKYIAMLIFVPEFQLVCVCV
jgi:hypothetical protein